MNLPVESVLPELRAALERHNSVVLTADPGAGKTTRVPVALLEERWLGGKKIIMLEPRRLAAQRAASFMARQRGEGVGGTIGYRIKGEAKIGRSTRIEVVTEGILTRMVQADQAMSDAGLVIFDEFHERSIHADLGLALLLDVQEHLRNDLKILVMSATLDVLSVSELLGGAPVLKSEGKMFPVETHYLQQEHAGHVEPLVVSSIVRAVREEPGDVLVFLPGQREIMRVESLLASAGLPETVSVHILHGNVSSEQQRAALAPPSSGNRKIILATSIAETSLTIDGVRVVIDSGLARSPRFDPRRGMSGLVTTAVSRATADQRRGRAGREQSGACYRLWTEKQHPQLQSFAPPEINVADLAPLAIELACWGNPEGKGLRFLDHPPSAHLAQARQLLAMLGALDENGVLTEHGIAIGKIPVHPRLAHMLIRSKELGFGPLACDIAALLEEPGLLRGEGESDVDLHSRWFHLQNGRARDKQALERVRTQSRRLREHIGAGVATHAADKIGVALALAYPERIAKRRGGEGVRFQLAAGTGAVIPKGSPLAREHYLAVADVDGVGSEVRIFLAAALSENELVEAFSEQLRIVDEVRWDTTRGSVVARQVKKIGELEIAATMTKPSSEVVLAHVLEGIRLSGLDVLPWNKDTDSLRVRTAWLRSANIAGDDWPDVSAEHLLATLERWLGPYLDGISARAHFQKLNLSTIIRALYSYRQLSELERLAPTHLSVPTGSLIPLVYSENSPPVLAVRLQEMFGERETPTVGGGKIKVLIHLLSPARRPLAITQDLPSFWRNAYADVRKDMRGRYPKHHWPENPLEAEPTKRSKRKSIK